MSCHELETRLAAVQALLAEPPVAIYEGENFMGFEGGPEHRTVGSHRAWCHAASEWCYPSLPCRLCEPPIEPVALRAALLVTQ